MPPTEIRVFLRILVCDTHATGPHKSKTLVHQCAVEERRDRLEIGTRQRVAQCVTYIKRVSVPFICFIHVLRYRPAEGVVPTSTMFPTPAGGKLDQRMSEASHRTVRFGVFEVDLDRGELRKHGLSIRLQDQPFQVLAALLERPGEVVSREELIQRLWPDGTVVDFDRGLNAAVTRLRQALSDSADTPRYVETVARRGYRFLGIVQRADPAAERSAPAGPSLLRVAGRPRIWLAAIPILFVPSGRRRLVAREPWPTPGVRRCREGHSANRRGRDGAEPEFLSRRHASRV
jgi:DNA-binding winged helix-turn-helix (wHTH) protein